MRADLLTASLDKCHELNSDIDICRLIDIYFLHGGIKCLDLERIQATSLATGKARLKFHTVANSSKLFL